MPQITTQPTIEFASPLASHKLVATLSTFREQLERDSGEPLQHLELNVALLLDDLCRFLQMNDQQRQQVLGQSAKHPSAILGECVTLQK